MLDPNSIDATAGCSVPSPGGVCDVIIGGTTLPCTSTTSCSQSKQFAVGVVITGATLSPLDMIDDVYGFEVSMSFDPTKLTAQGVTGVTVQFGQQTAHNWASFLATGAGFSVISIDNSAGTLTFALTLLAPVIPRDITAATILARVNFEIDAAVPSPGTIVSLTSVLLASDEAISITRSTKESVFFDANNDGLFNTGELVLNGRAAIVGAAIVTDANIKFVDQDGDGVYDPPSAVPTPVGSGEPIVYDSNGNGVYDAGEPNIFRLPSVGTSGLLFDNHIKFLNNNPNTDGWTAGGLITLGGAISEIITNSPPVASFTFSPAAPVPDPTDDLTTITFDVSGSSDIEDDAAATPLGFFMDFGDGLGEQDVTTFLSFNPATETFTYDLPCGPSFGTAPPCAFVVTLRVVDSAGATGLARDPASGSAIVDDQPSHTDQTITIQAAANTNPTINAGADEIVNEGTTLTHTVTASDPDAGQTLSFSLLGNATAAGATINPSTGTVTWATGEEDGPGLYEAIVTVSDGAGGSAVDSFLITVNEVNVAPTVNAGVDEIVNEGTTLMHTTTASDPDLPPQTLTFSLSGNASTAGAVINPSTGVVTWAIGEEDGPGVYEAIVTVSDGVASSSDSFIITVNEVNQNPTINAGADEMVNEGTTLTHPVTASDPDIPANTLTFSLSGNASTAGATINPSTGTVTWVIGEEDGPGVYEAVVTVSDGAGGSATDSFIITVNEVNVAPTVNAGADEIVNEGTTLTHPTTASDPDIPAQTLTFSLSGNASTAGAVINSMTGVVTWVLGEEDGPGVYGAIVTVSDGVTSSSDSFIITVNEVNQAPTVNAGADELVNEGTTLTHPTTASDADLPPQTLTFSLSGNASTAGAVINPSTGVVTWAIGEEDGPGVYEAVVTVSDGIASSSDSFIITVNEVNVAPTVNAGADEIVNEGTTLTHPTTASDPDIPAQTLTFSLSGNASTAGATINPSTGVVTWAIGEEDGPGVYEAIVTVSDGVASSSDSFIITVNEVNVAPTVNAGADEVANEGTTLTHATTASDPDIPPQTLTFSLSGNASTAGAVINSMTGVVTWAIGEEDGPGVYAAIVTVSDGVASSSDTFIITVNEVNVAPTINAGADEIVNEQTTLTHPVSASDPDLPPNTLTFSLSGNASTAGATINPSTGTVTWATGEEDGPGVYEAIVTVSDGMASSSDSFIITVNEVNVAPTVNAGADEVVDEGTTLTHPVTASDPDLPPNTLTFSLSGNASTAGATINPSTGTVTWAIGEEDGPGVHEAIVTVSDGMASSSDSFIITVNEVNVAPTINAGADEVINEGTTLVHPVTASDADLPPQTLTFSLSGNATVAGATINPSTGTVTWATGEEDGPGVYNAIVTVSDGITSSSDEFIITVNEVNQGPTLNAGADEVINEGSTLTHPVTATDPEADPLTFSLSGNASTAGATINPSTGTVTWVTDEADGPGVYEAIVTVTDGGSFVSDSFIITVNEVNQNPTINAGADEMVNEGTTLTHPVTASDPDIPANTLTFSLSGNASTAGATINSMTGVVTWVTGEEDGPGVYEAVVTVSDGVGGSATDSFIITVNEVNVAPTVNAGADETINEGSTLTHATSASDPDIPAQTLTFSLSGNASAAGAVINPMTGTVTWTTDEFDGPGVYEAIVTVSDGVASSSDSFIITVNEVNVAPTVNAGADETINEGSTLTHATSAADADFPAQTLTFSLSGNASTAGATINSMTGVVTWATGEEDGPGVYEAIVTVSDGVASSSDSFIITVNEVNQNPTINAGADETVNEQTTLTHPVTASDPDIPANTLTFSLSGNASAAGATINPSTGTVTWAIGEEDGPGLYEATVTVSDGAGGSATDSFLITVNEVNQNPTVDAGADETINEGSTLTHPTSASDPDIPANTLTFSLSGNASAAGATINSMTGVVTWATDEADGPGVYEAVVTVSDGVGGSGSDSFLITVNEVNQNPTINAGADETVDEQTTLTHPTTASDADLPPQTLTFSLSGNASTAGATINSMTGVVTWAIGEEDGPGVYEAVVTVTDSFGGSATDSFIITVNEVNLPPVASFTLSANVDDNEVTDNEPFTLTDTSTDPDIPSNLATITIDWGDGSPLETIAPGGMATHSYTSFGTFTITLTATDTGGSPPLSSTATRMINVVNHNPVAVIAAPATAVVGESVTFDGTGSSDPDAAFGDTINNFSWIFGDMTTGSGAVVTHIYTSTGTFTVTLTVMDNHGATGTAQVQIEIVPPNISGALVRGKASPRFHHQDLSSNPDNTFRAIGKNTGPVTAFFYVRFGVVRDDNVAFGPVFTSVVQLQPGELINGKTNPAFAAIFPTDVGFDGIDGTADDPNAAGYRVTATIFASVDNMISSDDIADFGSQKTFSFTAVSE